MILASLSVLVLGLCNFDEDHDDCREYRKDLDKLTQPLCEAGKVFRGEKEPSKKLLKW